MVRNTKCLPRMLEMAWFHLYYWLLNLNQEALVSNECRSRPWISVCLRATGKLSLGSGEETFLWPPGASLVLSMMRKAGSEWRQMARLFLLEGLRVQIHGGTKWLWPGWRMAVRRGQSHETDMPTIAVSAWLLVPAVMAPANCRVRPRCSRCVWGVEGDL